MNDDEQDAMAKALAGDWTKANKLEWRAIERAAAAEELRPWRQGLTGPVHVAGTWRPVPWKPCSQRLRYIEWHLTHSDSDEECAECDGEGTVIYYARNRREYSIDCPVCAGFGFMDGDPGEQLVEPTPTVLITALDGELLEQLAAEAA